MATNLRIEKFGQPTISLSELKSFLITNSIVPKDENKAYIAAYMRWYDEPELKFFNTYQINRLGFFVKTVNSIELNPVVLISYAAPSIRYGFRSLYSWKRHKSRNLSVNRYLDQNFIFICASFHYQYNTSQLQENCICCGHSHKLFLFVITYSIIVNCD